MWEAIYQKLNDSNIYFFRDHAMMLNSNPLLRGIKETIRIMDACKAEWDYAKKKFREKLEFINIEARSGFSSEINITSFIKCMYSFNHYRYRDTTINKNIVSNECLWYSEIET